MDNDSERKPSLWRRITASKYLRRESPPNSVREIIYWWEIRRVPYNLIVGASGLISGAFCAVAAILMSLSAHGSEFEIDGIFMQVALVILFGIAANICYTGGWIVEVVLFRIWKQGNAAFGPVSIVIGTAFSIALTQLPAMAVVAYAIYQVFAPAG